MAVYYLIDAAQPVRNGAAVGSAPQARAGNPVYLKTDREQDLRLPNGESALLDGRFKTGGTTGWERPGSNLT